MRDGYICRSRSITRNHKTKMTSNVPSMFLPDNIFGQQFGNGVQHEAFSTPMSLSEIGMEKNAELFNSSYTEGMSTWTNNMPAPTIYDSNNEPGMDETAQSQNEIVQKVLLIHNPDISSYEQHDFFFIKNADVSTTRAYYSSQSRYPYEAKTLSELRACCKDLAIEKLVQTYNPMGSFFNYVSFADGQKSSKLVAYSLGGLSDILNLWHVPIMPGMTLYFVAYKNDKGNTCIVPYAGRKHPMDKSLNHADAKCTHPWIDKESGNVAIIEVGVVCAGNSRQPLQLTNPNYLCEVGNITKPVTDTIVLSGGEVDPTSAKIPQVRGNILRIKMSCLQWQMF